MVTDPSHPSVTTGAKILMAARGVVGERGPERLTMSAVAIAAGVSRPTLYRWFPTKTLLLGAMAAAAVEDFDSGLQALVQRHRDPKERLDAALRYLITYIDTTTGTDVIRVDAAFALQSLADSLPPHIESLTRELGDALDQVPAVAAGRASREEAAEVLLRVAYSHYLVPDDAPEHVLAIVRAIAGIEEPTSSSGTRLADKGLGGAKSGRPDVAS
jgi:AcrR family transcriptional regulator